MYVDGHVVVAAGETVYGLDAGSGETAWTLESSVVPQDDALWIDATLRVHGGTVYALLGVSDGAHGGDYTLFALRPDGTERWRYSSDATRVHWMVGFADEAVVLATHDDDPVPKYEQATAIDRSDGGERWHVETGDAYYGAVGEGVVALGVPFEAVDCFDLDTGDRRFRFEAGDPPYVRSIAVGDGLVFVRVYRGDASRPTLYAFDVADGDRAWTWDEMRVGSIRHLDDLYVGGGSIFRLAPDGTVRWRYDGGGPVADVPFDDERLYTNNGSHLVAISRRDGAETWRTRAPGGVVPVARSSDLVLASDVESGHVSGYRVDEGRRKWRVTGPQSFHTPATGGDGAYLASEGGVVLKLPA